ncbi:MULTISPECIES: hypothetical protein [unclassified Micromonospora]|uniref:hypothetical protein n=1 Tax=unclassified Micromonospora TaxID=2617518 RepID=UPI0033B5E7DD
MFAAAVSSVAPSRQLPKVDHARHRTAGTDIAAKQIAQGGKPYARGMQLTDDDKLAGLRKSADIHEERRDVCLLEPPLSDFDGLAWLPQFSPARWLAQPVPSSQDTNQPPTPANKRTVASITGL